MMPIPEEKFNNRNTAPRKYRDHPSADYYCPLSPSSLPSLEESCSTAGGAPLSPVSPLSFADYVEEGNCNTAEPDRPDPTRLSYTPPQQYIPDSSSLDSSDDSCEEGRQRKRGSLVVSPERSVANEKGSLWMCVLDLDPLDVPECGSGLAAEDATTNDLASVYQTGLLPHLLHMFDKGDTTIKLHNGRPPPGGRSWQGHLPLADDDDGLNAAPGFYGSGITSSPRARRRLRRASSPEMPVLDHDARPAYPSPTTFVYSSCPQTFETVYIPEDSKDKSKKSSSTSSNSSGTSSSPPSSQGGSLGGGQSPSSAGAAGGGPTPPSPANAKSLASGQMSSSVASDVKSSTASAAGDAAAPTPQVKVQTPGVDRSALKDLPSLRDAPPTKREELFVHKLKLCSVIFSFDDPMADKRGKDLKRQTLLELVDYVNTPVGQKIFTESIMGDLMAMVSANVCRALPPSTDDYEPEEDEPVLEPAWPHLQVTYEFFLRFIVSSEVNAKAAKKYVDQKFCLQLVELFHSEDPRERDYLKTILHRIYGKFMSHRSFIRRAISNVFYRFVYETERHNGIGELLEILGSIINGFATPLKKEHLQFLARALIPLHKPKCVARYHQQLSYCIFQYVEKDADTAVPILNGFFNCWPWSSSGKQVMFLNELEEILELLGMDQLAQVSTMLFTNLARCLDSDHFQVVERTLFLWNNEHLVNSGCLSRRNAQSVLPIIYGPLYKNSSGHWNATVEGLAQNVLKMYMEFDLQLYDKCTAQYFREEEDAKKKQLALADKWIAIEEMAKSQQKAQAVA